MPLGKFIFFHLLVLVSIAFSISFLAPAALISVRAAFPHVRVFFSGSWSSVEFLFFFHENMVLPLGWSHSSCGVYSLVSSALCAVLQSSARESAASLRGSPLWALILKWSPLGFLSQIKRRTIGDRFPLSLWEVWFCSTLGVPIPALIGPSQRCACNTFDYDVCGDLLQTCQVKSAASQVHEWVVYRLGGILGSVVHKVKIHKITPATGRERGDLEIKDYVVLQKTQDQASSSSYFNLGFHYDSYTLWQITLES